jgi:porin-like protein
MKISKQLFLSSAAGFISITAAYAADPPVKAKAVEYVKICSLYGAGFYYIPGTDICIKIGSYIQFEETYANGGASMDGGPTEGTGGRNTRLDSQDLIMRTQVLATFDTRQQTQYGVLRTYLATGFRQDSTASGPTTSPAVYVTRGFIQIAGFTFGKATSYYDFFPRSAVAYNSGAIFMPFTGDSGQMVAAFTTQFGDGLSGSLSVEQSQRRPTVLIAGGPFTLGAAAAANLLGSAGGGNAFTGNPDVVANVRWDGTWGSFQIAGVLHDASAGYFGTTEDLGHPSNKWGWGASPGMRINAPTIGPGDYFAVAYSYTQGATLFASSSSSNSKLIWNGQNVAFGFVTDGVYGGSINAGTATDVQLTTAWSIAAAYEHFWTPTFQTSIYGSYLNVLHNATAVALICSKFTLTCDPNWSAWNLGSRWQWNVTPSLYVGLDVTYAKLMSAQANNVGAIVAGGGAKLVTTYRVSDQDAWNFHFRIHRDVIP